MSDWWNGEEFKPRGSGQPNRDLAWMVKDLEEKRHVDGLLALLGSGHPAVTRRGAARALQNLLTADKIPAVLEILKTETDRSAGISLIRTLGRLGDDSAMPLLFQLFKHREPLWRVEAANALARFNSPEAFQALLDGLGRKGEKDDYLTRQYSAEALGKMGDRRALNPLITALKDENGFVRAAAATALGNLGDIRAAEPLARARHADPHAAGVDCAECTAIDTALSKIDSGYKPS